MAEENHRILLDQIDYPSDLRKLEVKDLPEAVSYTHLDVSFHGKNVLLSAKIVCRITKS